MRAKGNEYGASALLKHAIELDPNFALAHAYLGTTYSNMGQTELYEKYLKEAFDLKDRASERERLYIAGYYYDATGDIDRVYRPGSFTIRRIPTMRSRTRILGCCMTGWETSRKA